MRRARRARRTIPVAMTLLGIGGFPASHPLNLGMMGMHGEAWVNHAIQEADLLLAFGMRFDDRVTGNLKTYAPNAKKIHVDIDPSEINKNVRVDVGDRRRSARRRSSDWLPLRRSRAIARAWLAHIDALKGDAAVRDIQNLPDNGHLYAAHVINDLWRLTDGNALVVTDVGQHQMWEAQYYQHDRAALAHHLRRPRHDGLRAAGGHRREVRAARRGSLGHRRRRRLPDDAGRAGDGRRRRALKVNIAIINNGYLGHGAAVAGVLLRAALRGHAAPQPRLRQARRGVRPRRRCASTKRARRGRRRRSRARAPAGAGASSTSRSSRKTACTRWCPPAPTCTR